MPGSDPTPEELRAFETDGRVKGLGICRKCGFHYPAYNIYGMGDCTHCGWKNNPATDLLTEQRNNPGWTHECHDPECPFYRREPMPVQDVHPPASSAPAVITDQIIRNIETGLYDDDLTALAKAVTLRQQKRKEDVLDLVHEVFGPNYEVTAPRRGQDFSAAPGIR